MPPVIDLAIFLLVMLAEWFRALGCVLVVHPLKGIGRALWQVVAIPVTEVAALIHVAGLPDGFNYARRRYRKLTADMVATWKISIPQADPDETERLDRIRNPERYRGRE